MLSAIAYVITSKSIVSSVFLLAFVFGMLYKVMKL